MKMKETMGPKTMSQDVEKFPQFESHDAAMKKHSAGHTAQHDMIAEHKAGHMAHHEAVAKMCGGGMYKSKKMKSGGMC
jgi:hypothetical protein